MGRRKDSEAPAEEAVPAPEVDDTLDVPAAITPSSTPEAAQDRVLYENLINSQAEAFANDARAAFIEAALNGQDIKILVSEPE